MKKKKNDHFKKAGKCFLMAVHLYVFGLAGVTMLYYLTTTFPESDFFLVALAFLVVYSSYLYREYKKVVCE